ncbi:MAG TPA: hypothetical protein ENG03_08000 [Thioploca sp.]|nr:hypothetical protein [Thioploca sp.]
MKKKPLSRLFTAGFLCSYPIIGATEPANEPAEIAQTTTIEITDEVLVPDTLPLGINLGGDSYYGPGVLLKVRDAENFEGTSYRQTHEGTLFEDGFASCLAKLSFYEETGWAELMRNGGQYTLISGPAKWTTGNIAAVSSRTTTCWRKEVEALFFAFETNISLPDHAPIRKMGLLVENLEPVKHGHTNKLGAYWAPSENCSLVEGDTPPKSYGYASLAMDGTEEKAIFRSSTHSQKYANLNGIWKYRFWAKVKAGNPQILVSAGKYGGVEQAEIDGGAGNEQFIGASKFFMGVNDLSEEQSVDALELFGEQAMDVNYFVEEEFGDALELFGDEIVQPVELTEGEWKKYEVTFQIDDVPELRKGRSPSLVFVLSVTGGILLVDDLSVEMLGDENPTAFRDEIITALKSYNPGVIRKLQMGGQTVKSTIMPRLKSHRGTNNVYAQVSTNTNRSLSAYGLHEFYELAEYIRSEPWFSLPGTMNKTEMEKFMEYLGAPADVGWGKLRAELGHPQPWTETLRKIHVEIGNEAWNTFGVFRVGGFNGPDYWHDLFATAKNSPYYHDNIILYAAGQNFSSWMSNRILERTPNADRYAIAPYQHHTFNQRDIDLFGNNEEFFSWFFARSQNEIDHRMLGHKEVMDKTGVEFAIYEVNHSPLRGDVKPDDIRNAIATSLGAGLNISNFMLQQLKKYHIRTQAFFNFSQFAFNKAAYGLENFLVRVWGGGINFRQGHERFRPTWLANELVNKVLAGDLLKTIQTGANPTYAVTGPFRDNGDPETKDGFPEILSYAFGKGKKRGLILYNLSTTTSQNISIQFGDKHNSVNATAESWLLTADSVAANNEPENEIQPVQVAQTTIEEFRPGITLTLPPHSLQVISWKTVSPLLVQLIDFEAVTEGDNIRLSWTTGSETNTAGFRIWRVTKDCHGGYTNTTLLEELTSYQAGCLKGELIATTGKPSQLISAVGNSREGAYYSVVDTSVTKDGTYYYVLEEVEMNKERIFHCDNIAAATKGRGSAVDLDAARNYCQQVTGSKK